MERNYETALSALNTYRRMRGTVAKPPPQGKRGGPPGLYRMRENLQLLGYSDTDLSRLNTIHVAGTKGKGTTCMLTNCFLRAHGERTGYPRKIGLYTGPFLISVRESIRISSEPISEGIFTQNFFDVWDKLQRDTQQNPETYRPGYNQILTLLALRTFLSEQVDVAIFETNCGGTYDATNIVNSNVVGITRLGIDHVSTLGSTIESIAGHKSGIIKDRVPAFSCLQVPAATAILQARADKVSAHLTWVSGDSRLPKDVLKPSVQMENAALALALASALVQQKGEMGEITTQDVSRGIQAFSLTSWPGRFHQIVYGHCQWLLDSAHNSMSMVVVGQWFAETTIKSNRAVSQILIFSHASERDGQALVRKLARSLLENGVHMQHVIFCKMAESQDLYHNTWFEVSEEIQSDYETAWAEVDPSAQISHQPSVEEALKHAKSIGDQKGGMQTLVTGSTFLVGAALHLLKRTQHRS